jgi:cell division septum initiation protein DivIVA
MSTETSQQPFSELAADLPDGHRAEFFRILHETGIGPEDFELAHLLRALQLYKAYYESIPSAVKQAAEKIEALKLEIEKIDAGARANLDVTAKLSGEVIQASEKVRNDLTQINKHIESALNQSARNLAALMYEQLSKGIEQRVLLPLQNRLIELSGSNQSFVEAIARNNKAAAALEKSKAEARRFHIRTYLVAGLAVVCALTVGSWLFLEQRFTSRFDQECSDLAKRFEKNRAVMIQLARSRRTIELVEDPERPIGKLLIMMNATGWQSPDKQGVIEFNE